jgi:hypothetical protein
VVEVFSATPISSPNAISILEELLFQTIVDRVRAFDVHSPAYGLLLVENAGYEATPPELAIGLDCEREAWSAAQLRDRERAWFPENVSLFDRSLSHLDDAGVQSAARQAQQTLRQAADPGGAHRLNVRLAKRLNDESQLLALPKTDDFVVVVVSLEGGLRRAELASYVPRAKLEALRTAGWL